MQAYTRANVGKTLRRTHGKTLRRTHGKTLRRSHKGQLHGTVEPQHWQSLGNTLRRTTKRTQLTVNNTTSTPCAISWVRACATLRQRQCQHTLSNMPGKLLTESFAMGFRAVFIYIYIYSMLRNNASGPEIGIPDRISAGFLSGKHQIRPFGRPKASRRADFDAFPTRIRPKSGPEVRFPARKHY